MASLIMNGDATWDVSLQTAVTPSSYIIYRDGTTTKAVNGNTGVVDYSGAAAATVIQNAINALSSGGLVFIKQGTYSLAAAIDISDKTISITGEHRYNTILQATGDVLKIINTSGLTARQSVSNIMLDGTDSSGTGLGITLAYRCNFDNLYIKNCNYGVKLDRTIVNTFYNPYIAASNTGMYFYTDVASSGNYNNANVVVGGEINNGNPGVLIYGTASGNRFYGTVIEGGQTTQVILKSARMNAGSDSVPNSNVFDGCWFETVTAPGTPVHVDIQKDAACTYYPWSNIVTNGYFAADENYTAITNPGDRNILSSNYLSGSAGQTATITVSGNDNIIAFNSVAFNTLAISNSGSRNLLKTNYGYTTFLTVLSPTFAIDAVALVTVTIAHGLSLTPNTQDCSLTVVSPTQTDWAYNLLYVDSITSSNVVAKINISAASVTGGATARLSLRVGKP